MSAPTTERLSATETVPLPNLDTADLLTIDRVLHDGRIIADLERQFGPDTVSQVDTITHNNRYSSINEAHPTALKGVGVEVVGTRLSPIDTITPNTTEGQHMIALAQEPEVPHGEPRPYTPEESEVILTALRKAAHIPGHRREATLVLADHSPKRMERISRQLALVLATSYLSLQHPSLGRYQGRHRA